MALISVAMISMNEEKAISRVLGDIKEAVGSRDAEIVLVDSSKDATPEIAAAFGARVIRQFPPKGYGPAMERALQESRGDVVITLDCDGSYPAGWIPKLADMVLGGGSDLVNASRLPRKPESMPWPNYVANRAFAIAARLLLRTRFTDLHSGMRAYSRELIAAVPFDAQGPALPVELLLKPALMGYRVTEVFIPYHERVGTSTLHRWSSTMWTLRRICRLAPLAFRHKARPVEEPGA